MTGVEGPIQPDHRCPDIDAILDLYETSVPATDRAWRDLVVASAGLGAALGRFQSALDAYGEAKRSATADKRANDARA